MVSVMLQSVEYISKFAPFSWPSSRTSPLQYFVSEEFKRHCQATHVVRRRGLFFCFTPHPMSPIVCHRGIVFGAQGDFALRNTHVKSCYQAPQRFSSSRRVYSLPLCFRPNYHPPSLSFLFVVPKRPQCVLANMGAFQEGKEMGLSLCCRFLFWHSSWLA